MGSRTLLVVSATLDERACEAVAAGLSPRKDYFELARALDAEIIDYGLVTRARRWRLLRRAVGMPVTQAVAAFTRRHVYSSIFTDGEQSGLPLALLLRLVRRRPRVVTLGHLLTTPTKRATMRWLRPQRCLDAVIVHASRQAQLARDRLGLSGRQVLSLPYQVDHRFWRPEPDAKDDQPPMICSAGLEYRDYPTLIAAVRSLPVQLVIAAASHWSRHRSTADAAHSGANLSVTALDYVGLRRLYARARFVVVPLREGENQAGITVILEAMAMGKAVIVSATRGQRDVIRGRLCTAAGLSATAEGGPAAFGLSGAPAEAETGLYVPPGDAAALRRAIEYLLARPEEAARMGRAGRQLVEQCMNLDLFVQRIAAVVRPPEQGLAPRPARGASATAGATGF